MLGAERDESRLVLCEGECFVVSLDDGRTPYDDPVFGPVAVHLQGEAGFTEMCFT